MVEFDRTRVAIRLARDLTEDAIGATNVSENDSGAQLCWCRVRERESDQHYRAGCTCDHASSSSLQDPSPHSPAEQLAGYGAA